MLRSEALQQAKRTILSEKDEVNNLNYHHPFFWASYSIYGKPEIPNDREFPFYIAFLLLASSFTLFFLIYIIRTRIRSKGNR
jgi:hypothetical protein